MTDVKYVLKEGECMEKVEDTENEYKYKFYVGSIYTAFRQWQVGISNHFIYYQPGQGILTINSTKNYETFKCKVGVYLVFSCI